MGNDYNTNTSDFRTCNKYLPTSTSTYLRVILGIFSKDLLNTLKINYREKLVVCSLLLKTVLEFLDSIWKSIDEYR